MKRIVQLRLWVLVPLLLVGSGCGGGLTQKEMMRHAIRRAPADDENQVRPASVVPKRVDVVSNSPLPPTIVRPASATSGTAPTEMGKSSDPLAEDPSTYIAPEIIDSESTSREGSLSQAVAKMERIGAALEAYCDEIGHYPPPAIYGPRKEPLLSWRVALLPLLGHRQLYEQFRLEEPWNSEHNQSLLPQIPPVLSSGGEAVGKTSFLLPVGAGTAFAGHTGLSPKFIEDGAENTVILIEVDRDHAVAWTAPEDHRVDLRAPTLRIGAKRTDGFLVVWGGGVVKWIDSSTPQRQLQTIFTTDSGDGFTASEVGRDPLAVLKPSHPNTLPDTKPTTDDVINPPKTVEATNASDSLPAIAPKMLRHPMPAADKITEAKYLLAQIYQAEYKAAVNRQQKLAVLERMLSHLESIDADLAGQYALLEIARQISVQIGSIATGLEAAEELANRFEIDSHSSVVETLAGLSHTVASQESQVLTQGCLEHCQSAYLGEDYDVAGELCRIAMAAARKFGNAKQKAELTRIHQEVQAAGKAHRLAERALKTLEQDPADAAANAAVGKYLCVYRNEWSNGLPMLANGDGTLGTLAERDLNGRPSAEEQAKLGDAWWAIGDKAEAGERRAMLWRAVYWYQQCVLQLPPGLIRLRTQRRIEQFDRSNGGWLGTTTRQ